MKRVIYKCIKFFFRLLPLQKKVVFFNFYGKGMGDDPKYIALALLKRYPSIRIIWAINNESYKFPEGIEPVKMYSIKYYYHMITSSVWVDNVKHCIKDVEKRVGQFYIQTWHGGIIGLKKVEEKALNLPESYVSIAKHDAACTDLMYSDNDYTIDLFKHTFWYNGAVLKCGVPRLSVLLSPPAKLKESVKAKLNIPQKHSIILYAPTFRKTDDASVFVWDYKQVLSSAVSKFGKEYVMIIRLHPNVSYLSREIDFDQNIFDGSYYPDMQELLAASDILITDYSSTMFEFPITGKPVFLYGKDVVSYVENDRGLEFDLLSLPFTMNKTVEELSESIKLFDVDVFKQKVHEFYAHIGLEENGRGADTLASIIANRLNVIRYE